jgi:putative transposase
MARPLRLEFPHALYHLTSRGDRREDIYLSDADRLAWLSVLTQVCQCFGWIVHAYCLMSNHYHLLVETPLANLSQGMRQLNGVYTQLFNRAHGKVGHVFQGRFKAIVLDREGYLLELARYIVLNPVRAGMVAGAREWPWSSYGAMVGSVDAPPWLATDALLAQFAPKLSRARALYVDHVRAGVGLPPVWEQLEQQMFLGDEVFMKRMGKLVDQNLKLTQAVGGAAAAREFPKVQRLGKAKPIEHFEREHAQDRNAAMAAAFASRHYTLAQIAAHFGVHSATVSRAVAKKGA